MRPENTRGRAETRPADPCPANGPARPPNGPARWRERAPMTPRSGERGPIAPHAPPDGGKAPRPIRPRGRSSDGAGNRAPPPEKPRPPIHAIGGLFHARPLPCGRGKSGELLGCGSRSARVNRKVGRVAQLPAGESLGKSVTSASSCSGSCGLPTSSAYLRATSSALGSCMESPSWRRTWTV